MNHRHDLVKVCGTAGWLRAVSTVPKLNFNDYSFYIFCWFFLFYCSLVSELFHNMLKCLSKYIH